MNNKNNIAAFLAITAMLGFLVIFGYLGWGKVPPENKDFFNMGFVALIGFVGTAFGYYLGSSLGSAQKNDLIAQATTQELTPPPPAAQAGFIRLPLVISVLLILIAIFGCATTGKQEPPQSIAAKSLLTTRQGIIAAATTADSLCSQGFMLQNNCTRASLLYIEAQKAYTVAADAFLLYLVSGDAVARQQYDQALPQLGQVLSDLDSLIQTNKGVAGGKL